MTTTQQFSHEKLEVYQLALSFVGWLANLLPELKANKEARIGEVVDQIDRASTSIVLKETVAGQPSKGRVFLMMHGARPRNVQVAWI